MPKQIQNNIFSKPYLNCETIIGAGCQHDAICDKTMQSHKENMIHQAKALINERNDIYSLRTN